MSLALWKWPSGVALCVALGAGLVFALKSEGRVIYQPGSTSAGHHQIADDCAACHQAFSGTEQACHSCHGDELEGERDAHRPEKFNNPRDFWMLERIDARRCASCHAEHKPDATRAMTLTLPPDFCVACHADIGKERQSHAAFEPASCASTGCHRYHDNSALYEDFIARHLDEPPTRPAPVVLGRNPGAAFTAAGRSFGTPVTRAQADAPKSDRNERMLEEWAESSHAKAGINCRACHERAGAQWDDHPKPSACKTCHELELTGFLQGRHGMRLDRGLSPMQPALARLPMKEAASHEELDCASCHGAHRFDTKRASVEACTGCHDDRHTRSYAGSAHERLWREELAGRAPPGSGVSCATCHLPRYTLSEHGKELVRVQHNQNDNLRPNDKFVRSVCLTCHGLGFSFDSLADVNLAIGNFRGQPARQLGTLDMVRERKAD